MLAEGDPKKIEFIKNNIYRSFNLLLCSTGFSPNEFREGTTELKPYDKKRLEYAAIDAQIEQLKFYIDQLKSEFDPENYASRILEILNSNKNKIDNDLYEDLINYIRYGRKTK